MPPGRTDMKSPTIEATPKANETVVAPTLHAFVVTPAVGSVILMFVAVGMAALAVGALSGFAGRPGQRKHRSQAPNRDET